MDVRCSMNVHGRVHDRGKKSTIADSGEFIVLEISDKHRYDDGGDCFVSLTAPARETD